MGRAQHGSRGQELASYPPEVVERYRARGVWCDRSLWDLFAERCRRHAGRPALTSGEVTLSYA
ncbi:MAG: 2,3-dihydroxybenzoate-AMP ligase, partial [Candidatus Dormibacteraceae bacterium]